MQEKIDATTIRRAHEAALRNPKVVEAGVVWANELGLDPKRGGLFAWRFARQFFVPLVLEGCADLSYEVDITGRPEISPILLAVFADVGIDPMDLPECGISMHIDPMGWRLT